MKAKPATLVVVVVVALLQGVAGIAQTGSGSAGTFVLIVVSELPAQPGVANPTHGETLERGSLLTSHRELQELPAASFE